MLVVRVRADDYGRIAEQYDPLGAHVGTFDRPRGDLEQIRACIAPRSHESRRHLGRVAAKVIDDARVGLLHVQQVHDNRGFADGGRYSQCVLDGSYRRRRSVVGH